MRLKITVMTGLTSGTEYPIEKHVIRIGAGSQCDICLPVSGLETYVATVEFRNGEAVLYNRSLRPIQIGNTVIAPSESANWPLGHALSLTDGAVLKLEKDVLPAKAIPEKQGGAHDSGDPRLDHVDFESQRDDVTENRLPWTSKALQAGIIVIAVGVVLTWLTLSSNNGAAPSSEVAAAEKADSVVEVTPERNQAREQITEELRFAKAALYREDWERAELALAIIQQKLINGHDNQEFEKNVLQRVKAARQNLRAREN